MDRKIKQAQNFLVKKQQVRVTVVLHGRQLSHPERGFEFLAKVAEDLAPYGTVANKPTERNMSLVFNPKK